MTSIADATTTISSPHESPGGNDVLRDSHFTFHVSEGAHLYQRTSPTGTFSQPSLAAVALSIGLNAQTNCSGDLPQTATSKNNEAFTPFTKVSVDGPGGNVMTGVSPALNIGLSQFGKPQNPQPTAPAAKLWRGEQDPPAGLDFDVDLTGKPAGTYTITTTINNMVRIAPTALSAGTCSIGTADRSSSGAFLGTFTAGPQVETHTFEYRPWQQEFNDINAQGTVSFNVNPAESRQSVVDQGGVRHTGDIVSGHMSFFALPSTSSFSLPADPSACAANPSSCLPSNAVSCNPAAGCAPRIVIISRSDGTETLQGVFDLQTRAFIALSNVGGYRRILLSLGPQGDAYYGQLIQNLRTTLAASGFDVDHVLGLGVDLSNGKQTWRVTLLNGLQVDPVASPAGIRILTDLNVQAGLLLDVFIKTAPGACTTQSASSAAGDDGFKRTAPFGFTVERTSLVPNLPTAAGLEALGVGGPIWHIKGDFQTLASPTAPVTAISTAARGVDVSPGETPLASASLLVTGAPHVVAPRTTDFIGTANWTMNETSLGALGCLSIGGFLGAGVALNNNPLPIGFGNLPIWKTSPALDSLNAAITSAVQGVVDQATTLPVVADLLTQILGLVPSAT
jgi:hypothetical protein